MSSSSSEIPPRRMSSSVCKTSGSNHRTGPQTPLQILVHMGVPKHRAEKALAATGYRGPQYASEWLLNHVNDPTLDDASQREFILYLCPSGSLLEQLDKFYSESLLKTGFNTAHNYHPHITLCSFFQAPDEAVCLLVNGLEHCVEKMRSDLPSFLRLELYSSQQFIGLFLSEEQNDILKRLANMFMRECSEFISGGELGPMHVISTCFPWCSSYPLLHPKRIEVEPYLKNLHLTLSYQFEEKFKTELHTMALATVDVNSSSTWELRLYSRESRLKGNDVYRVLIPHDPSEIDELELMVGDFVYINPDAVKASTDGWVEATSWLTGCSGLIPVSLVERTAESNVWTLHKSISLSSNTNGYNTTAAGGVPFMPLVPAVPMALLNNPDADTRRLSSDDYSSETSSNVSSSKALINPSADGLDTSGGTSSKTDARKLIIIRHGERIDFTFGHGWIPVCFDSDGSYRRKDLNQPKDLPKRSDPFSEYTFDSPLTNIGLYQASLTGKALAGSGLKICHIYSSPSLRCVQTTQNILSELNLGSSVKINIEPGLFEWMTWYLEPNRPKFMSIQELVNYGFHVNPSYVPLLSVKELFAPENETLVEYYQRSHRISSTILSSTVGNVLFVGHAATLDTCSRQLVSQPIRSEQEFFGFLNKIPYCGVCSVQESSVNPDQQSSSPLVSGKSCWSLVKPQIQTIQHTANPRYNWKCLLN